MTEARARLDALPTTYPRLFPNGALPWGFEHGDGWSQVVVILSERLDTILQASPGASIEVVQVKEKFGGLRFYYSLHGVNDDLARGLREAVTWAQGVCARVCERCGRRGFLDQSQSGWFSTLCPTCHADRESMYGSDVS